MLARRIIPCLDVAGGRTVKGVEFLKFQRDAGDPLELAEFYARSGADELVFLDIEAHRDGRPQLCGLISRLSKALNIPFTVGGGIATLEHARELFGAGADKVSVNSAAVRKPELISVLAREFGSQAIVVAIDAKREGGEWRVFTAGGREPSGLVAREWALQAQDLGAGEILLTSIDRDGRQEGFALDLMAELSSELRIPLIASGGAGRMEDFEAVLRPGYADAALGASVFHFGIFTIGDLKSYLARNNIPVRM